MHFDKSPRIGEAGPDAAPASLAARIGSLVPAAADPHTLAITIWNGSPTVSGGWIEVDITLQDDAEGYELVDAEGVPVPHLWLGDTGTPPTRLNPTRSEIPDFEEIMARLDGDPILGATILDLSMRVLRDTLHIEATLGEGDGLSRAELAESVRDAQSLADDAECGRVALTLHRTALLHLAAWVSAVPGWGYTTSLVRPRPKGTARTRKAAAPTAELGTAIGSAGQHALPDALGYADEKDRALPEVAQATAVGLHAYVGPCVEGVLPPSGSVVIVSPETVVASAFQWRETGDGAVLQLFNESDHAENARVELLLPAHSAALTNREDHPDEILWKEEPRTDFRVAVPPNGITTVRLEW